MWPAERAKEACVSSQSYVTTVTSAPVRNISQIVEFIHGKHRKLPDKYTIKSYFKFRSREGNGLEK